MNEMTIDLAGIRTVLCDLDGVVWLAHQPISGAVGAIDRLRRSGRRIVFVTNNSAALISAHEHALAAIGIPATGDVVSSAMAGAALTNAGERVLVTGGAGVMEAVANVGATPLLNDGVTVHDAIDAVVVGLHRDFDYQRLRLASRAVRQGARLIGTNGDTTYPTPDGLDPGGGAILAAVAAASGVEPTIGGKPHLPMADVVRRLLDDGTGFDPATAIMVGDRPETDGLFAERLGSPFALVRSGVTAPGDEPAGHAGMRVTVSIDVLDLAALADLLINPS